MPRDGGVPPAAPSRRRSRTVRAAALVTLGLGAAGCDDGPSPDLPGRTEARLDACRAAHRRLGEDPARCDLLEQMIEREYPATRPQFTTIGACETVFGRGSCDGETLASGPSWRPVLAGWLRGATSFTPLVPVLRDRGGAFWSLPGPQAQPSGIASMQPPRQVPGVQVQPGAPEAERSASAYYRLAPVYPDEASCDAEWQDCARIDFSLPNRFGTEAACRAAWTQCIEVELPRDAVSMQVAQDNATTTTPPSSSTTHGTTRPSTWWIAYNSGYRQNYVGGIGPRYQGWTWTADHRPTAAFRPATGTGPLQAWDSSSRRLGTASRMRSYGGGSRVAAGSSIARPASTISRAGFGSTGRAYSSGG